MKIDAVITQKSYSGGFTASEIAELLQQLELTPDEEVCPVLAEGDNAVAFGFIRNQTITDVLKDEFGTGSQFERELLEVVNDTDLESPDKQYNFAGVQTFMDY